MMIIIQSKAEARSRASWHLGWSIALVALGVACGAESPGSASAELVAGGGASSGGFIGSGTSGSGPSLGSGGAASGPALGGGGAASGPGIISSSGGSPGGSGGSGGGTACVNVTQSGATSPMECTCYPSAAQPPGGDSGGDTFTPVSSCDTSTFDCCCTNANLAGACFCLSSNIDGNQVSCSTLCSSSQGTVLSSCP